MLRAIDRNGVWLRAGMGGDVSGLSLQEALATLPDDCDRAFATRLLVRAENSFLIGREATKKDKADGDKR